MITKQKCNTVRYERSAVVIKLVGDVCYDTVSPLYSSVNEILKQNKTGLVFDLSGVEFIDSKGAAFLLDVKKCVYGKRPVVLASVPAYILAVLSRMTIADRFRIFRSVDDALSDMPQC